MECYKNLTGHILRIAKTDGTVLSLDPYALKPLRADEVVEAQTQLKGITVKKKSYTTSDEEMDKILKLMYDERTNTGTCMLIVSMITALALKGRGVTYNIFIPGTLDKATGICDGLCVL